ncbi:MAG: histidine kinase [Acetivibrionales bacterium]
MKIKRFEEFTYIILVNASQVAYHEEAPVTHSLLSSFNEVYRYIIKKEDKVLLEDEISILKKYFNVQKIRYGNKFSVLINENLSDKAIYINHLSVIDFVDYVFNDTLGRCEGSIGFNITFYLEEAVAMDIEAQMDGKSSIVSKVLQDKEDICVQIDDCG